MTELTKLPNIGDQLAHELRRVGIAQRPARCRALCMSV